MNSLRSDIANAARTDAKVLITGETGVGKEVVAGLIHRHSRRSERPFVALNCLGIPESLLASELFGHTRGSFTGAYRDRPGLLRQAHGGTLFLDELGEMQLAMQAMLLRFTESGEIQPVGMDGPVARADVRIITATNNDLRGSVAGGTFREDLYYRLNVIQIRIPPLRERGEDVMLLFWHYMRLASAAERMPCPELTADAGELVRRYPWPGNVRELRNVTERLALLAPSAPLTPADLPADLRHAPQVEIAPAGGPGAEGRQVVVEQLWDELRAGGEFWAVVERRFRAQEVLKPDLIALIDRGLRETRGSYRALVTLFNLAPTDYKRFHGFLYQQSCNLPVATYRSAAVIDQARPFSD